MTTNDWKPITELPKPGQKVVALYSDDALALITFDGEPFRKGTVAWQPWADPPAPDPFYEAFFKSGLDAKAPNVQNIFEAGWNAALAHCTHQTFDEYWASLPLLGPRLGDKCEVRGLPDESYCIEKEAARAVWKAAHAATTERPWKWETFEDWETSEGAEGYNSPAGFYAARERKEA